MIILNNVTLQRGQKVLFQEASCSIFAKQKVGIVGINGSGKSSLFSMILGQLHADAGNLSLHSGLSIAHLSQEIPHSAISAVSYVLNGDQGLMALTESLEEAELNQDHIKAAQLHTKIYEVDGYAAESRARQLLNGLGFKDSEQDKAVNEFSGGWRMRLNLARVLMSRADLLLLDEPTNHLDLDAILWLERWLKCYEGTLLLISHDRDFLDNVVNKIVHITQCKLDLYSGNYSAFEERRTEKLLLEQAMLQKQQAQIKHIEQFVKRFRYKASKARQVQSRVKALERMAKVAVAHIDSPFSFEFKEPARCSAPLLKYEQLKFGYLENSIFDHVDFTLNPGDRIGLLGPNGAGKSTLIKLLCGVLKPQDGKVHQSASLKIGYYAQHQVDQLRMDESAFFHIAQLDLSIREQQIRDFLGGFNFRGDRVFEVINKFSGGEKARLTLAMLVWQQPNLLLLDEPTNHLDLDMREALTYALQGYTGALVLVSHDRHLLRTTVDDFYLVCDQSVSRYEGDLQDYQDWLTERRRESLSEEKAAKPKIKKERTRNIDSSKKLEKIDAKLSKLYVEKKEIESALAHGELYQERKKESLEAKLECLDKLNKEISLLEEEWDQL